MVHINGSDIDMSVHESNSLRMIGNKVKKFIFTDKITKTASEFLLRCVGEYEEQMIRMFGKNERLMIVRNY